MQPRTGANRSRVGNLEKSGDENWRRRSGLLDYYYHHQPTNHRDPVPHCYPKYGLDSRPYASDVTGALNKSGGCIFLLYTYIHSLCRVPRKTLAVASLFFCHLCVSHYWHKRKRPSSTVEHGFAFPISADRFCSSAQRLLPSCACCYSRPVRHAPLINNGDGDQSWPPPLCRRCWEEGRIRFPG